MIRLLTNLSSLSEKAEDIQSVYDGKYIIPAKTAANPTGRDEEEFDPTYWTDDGCFMQITPTSPESPMLASVLLGIPACKLGIYYDLGNEVDNLKRLKNILLGMKPNTEKFDEMYSGNARAVHMDGSFPPESVSDPIYWREGVFYHITQSGRLKPDCPTVTIGIPAEELGISEGTQDYVIADWCLRAVKPYMDELNDELFNRSRPVEENGWFYFCQPGGEITVRNSAYFAVRMPRDYDYGSGINIYPWVGREVPKTLYLCLMIQVQLPYHKMKKSIRMLTADLPKAMDRYIREFDREALARVIELSQRQRTIREFLRDSGYCAFIANGSVLPRSKGTDLPMQGGVPFRSPAGDEIEVAGTRGMGIRRGVTVITGGGYSGKSTLIDAIAAGINNHALGDGRELCITDSTAATVCAEDGRAISHVNISPFIKGIPGADTRDFSTDRASGSTSEAANIMEAVDSGAKLLLIDEDRSATNFMIRDPIMRRLIKDEPITPFTERVRELSADGISTILVIGGSGEYLSVADKVYIMEGYQPNDITELAREVSAGLTSASGNSAESSANKADWTQRKGYLARGFDSHKDGVGKELLRVFDLGIVMLGSEELDLRSLHDIKNPRQLHALGLILRLLMCENPDALLGSDKPFDVDSRLDDIYRRIERDGLDVVFSPLFGEVSRFLDLPRLQDVKAVISRMRNIGTYVEGGERDG